MTARTQLHILKVEVSHGSDRHEIALYSNTPPTVGELMTELEKKTRVPWSNMQLLFKGQKLHLNPHSALADYGAFTGSRFTLVGEKFSTAEDGVFRRILGIGKDIGLIEKTFQGTANEFLLMENGTIDRSLAKEYLPQMHYRVCGMKRDYETFLRVISELQVDQKRMPDVKRHQINITNQIRSNIETCDSLLRRIDAISQPRK